jgi:hypothetical protein
MHLFLNIVAYMPFYDLFVGSFVLVRLIDPRIYLVWMGRVESDVVRNKKMRIIGRSMFNGGFL